MEERKRSQFYRSGGSHTRVFSIGQECSQATAWRFPYSCVLHWSGMFSGYCLEVPILVCSPLVRNVLGLLPGGSHTRVFSIGQECSQATAWRFPYSCVLHWSGVPSGYRPRATLPQENLLISEPPLQLYCSHLC